MYHISMLRVLKNISANAIWVAKTKDFYVFAFDHDLCNIKD